MICLVADTNFFIQYKKYDEVNFQELFDDKPTEFTLLIPRTVTSELDKHKNQGNDRVARKARAMIPLLREIIKEPIVQDKHNYQIIIDRLKRISTKQDHSNDLDLDNPDEKIIYEVLNWKANNPNEKIFLITGDMGMCSLCFDYDIPYIELPESWLLPPEQDEQKKELEKAKKELLEFKKAAPSIEIIFDKFVYNHFLWGNNKLTAGDISDIKSQLQRKFPCKNDFIGQDPHLKHLINLYQKSSPFAKSYPTAAEIENYFGEYSQWFKSLTTKVYAIESEIEKYSLNFFNLMFSINNIGSAYADDLFVTLTSSDKIFFYVESEKNELIEKNEKAIYELLKDLYPPVPPKLKENPLLNPINILGYGGNHIISNGMSFLLDDPIRKDPFIFYLHQSKKGQLQKEITFCCNKFRNGNQHDFEVLIIIPNDFNEKVARIDLNIVARNLIKPISKTITIKLDNQIERMILAEITKGIDLLDNSEYL